ncbi:MAG: hypothetical protein ABW189_04110 [Rickettsiales bacterium]
MAQTETAVKGVISGLNLQEENPKGRELAAKGPQSLQSRGSDRSSGMLPRQSGVTGFVLNSVMRGAVSMRNAREATKEQGKTSKDPKKNATALGKPNPDKGKATEKTSADKKTDTPSAKKSSQKGAPEKSGAGESKKTSGRRAEKAGRATGKTVRKAGKATGKGALKGAGLAAKGLGKIALGGVRFTGSMLRALLGGGQSQRQGQENAGNQASGLLGSALRMFGRLAIRAIASALGAPPNRAQGQERTHSLPGQAQHAYSMGNRQQQGMPSQPQRGMPAPNIAIYVVMMQQPQMQQQSGAGQGFQRGAAPNGAQRPPMGMDRSATENRSIQASAADKDKQMVRYDPKAAAMRQGRELAQRTGSMTATKTVQAGAVKGPAATAARGESSRQQASAKAGGRG